MSQNRFYYFVDSVYRNALYRNLLRQKLPRNSAVRSGLTLVEILVAVTLMLVIMLAVVQVFAYVGRTINKNQNAMIISGRLRTAQIQLDRDLELITAPLTPPLRFDDAQGYFCIIEGLGSYYRQQSGNNNLVVGKPEDIAKNKNGDPDSTIGDMDDILMFTMRAPGNTKFRGLVGGEIKESKEAEVCYFVRGTTLYRRVLLIYPDSELQKVLNLSQYSSGLLPAKKGFGFYRDFDVSVHLDENGDVRANTLSDLTRRENRYGHWNKEFLPNGEGSIASLKTGTVTYLPFPYGVQSNAAWYQLRLPTLAECTEISPNTCFRAGRQIVTSSSGYDKLVESMKFISTSQESQDCSAFPITGSPYIDYWDDPLPWDAIDTQRRAYLMPSKVNADHFFISGNSTSDFKFTKRENEDVLLTNIISFDVEVWNPKINEFGGLGSNEIPTNQNVADSVDAARMRSKDLGTFGFYGPFTINDEPEIRLDDLGTFGFYGPFTTAYYNNTIDPNKSIKYGLLPAVYDTWTDAYENEMNAILSATSVLDRNGEIIPGITSTIDGIADVMEHVDKWNCPPPYTAPLTGIQIKIRIFDNDTNNIREAIVRKHFKK
ncbi:MAG: hypothetical protein LBT05_06525 [Planctomycetaceae bacterium]|nr:hypothetical protein [Planctomycetaceae bacterium]